MQSILLYFTNFQILYTTGEKEFDRSMYA